MVDGNSARTAIDKRPVTGRVSVAALGLAGDEFADKANHGGRDQAVYAYAREDLDWWVQRLGYELRNGQFGENITTAGAGYHRRADRRDLADRHGRGPGHQPADPLRHLPVMAGRAALGKAVRRGRAAWRVPAGAGRRHGRGR